MSSASSTGAETALMRASLARPYEDTKKLISEKSKNKVISKEQRAKISQTLTGRKQSKETIEKRIASIAKRRLELAK
jgi:hypothetical protein